MSYLRDNERLDSGLPSIRRSAWDASPGRLTTLENGCEHHHHGGSQRYHSASASRVERESLMYPRPPSPSQARRQTELHEQLRIYKEEMMKKDRLISQLTSLDTPRPSMVDTSQMEEAYSAERTHALASAKSELAAMSVRIEGLQNQVRELTVQLEVRDEKTREMRLQFETARESEAKQAAMVSSLRQKLMQYEASHGNLEGAANRSEVAIDSLQRENREYAQRVAEMESRIRQYQDERQTAMADRSIADVRLKELLTKITATMHFEDCCEPTVDCIISKMTEVMQDNTLLRSKLATMKDYVNNAEMETKASQETIMRLVSEAEMGQKHATRYTREMENLRMERDGAVSTEVELRNEVRVLQERVESTSRALSVVRQDLDQKEGRYSGVDHKLHSLEIAARNAEAQYRSFKDSLAAMLSDSYTKVEPFEEAIHERVQSLKVTNQDRSAHVEELQRKISELTSTMESQYEMNRNADMKNKMAASDVLELQERLRRAEQELASGDCLRDGLRVDKERYLRFLERVSTALGMDPISGDLGLDHLVEAILGRAEQLIKMESNTLVDRKTHIYNLQRKMKSMKEQLESKDLHMDLLRKKVAAMEERLVGKSEAEREKDEEYIKNKKLLKLVEKYKRELTETRLEVRDLKARLLESTQVMNRTIEQERELEVLETKVGQLENVRSKQANKIAGLRDTLEVKSSEFEDKREVVSNTVGALTSELRTTKAALNEVTKRERQLLDLRQVFSRMLGLDVTSLAVPDYEIISRLEKLILANQANATTAVVLDTAMEDMEEGFRAGYDDAARSLARRTGTGTNMTRSRVYSGRQTRTRTRSLSPNRKRDTRAY